MIGGIFPTLSKVNVNGSRDVKGVGQLVQYKLTPGVIGSSQEALQSVFVRDFLDSRYEFVRFVDEPDTLGAACSNNATTVTCSYPSSGSDGLPGGWPAGEPDPSFIIELRVVEAVSEETTLTAIRNTAVIGSGQTIEWDPVNDQPATGALPAANRQRVFSFAESFLPLAFSDSEIVKAVDPLQGVCDAHPTLDISTFSAQERADWEARCSLINLNGNMSFDLTVQNNGNDEYDEIEFIDVLPHNADNVEPASNTPNQPSSTPNTVGDGRDPRSEFSGTLSFVSVSDAIYTNSAGDVVAPASRSTVTWVTGDPAGSISRDPLVALANNTFCDAAGGTAQNTAQNPSAVDANCPTTNAEVTGVYVLIDGQTLLPGQSASVKLTLDSEDAECNDVWTNTFGFRTPNIALPTRSNDVSVMVGCVSVGSTIFRDLNNNGIKDATEAILPGVGVELFRAGDDPTMATAVATTTSGSNGEYIFDGLAPGDYFIYIPTPPVGFPNSSTDIATTNADNQTDGDDNGIQAAPGGPVQSPDFNLARGMEPTGASEQIEPGAGSTNGAQDDVYSGADGSANDLAADANGDMTLDFGFTQNGAIGDLVFIDIDGDGVLDVADGDGGLGGVDVTISYDDPDNPGNTISITTTTAADGSYLVENLPLNVDYTVTVDTNDLPGVLGTDIVPSSDSDGIVATPNSSMVRLTAAAPRNLDQDFGYLPLGTIGDTIWVDSNRDGVIDIGEVGIENVRVTLTPPTGVDIGAGAGMPLVRITDANGQYLFEGIPPNIALTVAVDSTTIASNLVQTGDPDTAIDGMSSVTLALDPTDSSRVIGNLLQDFGYAPSVSIGGFVFEDQNLDGLQTAPDPAVAGSGEPPVPGSTVQLLNADGSDADDINGDPVPPIVIGPNGQYLFDNLAEGDYRVQITRPDGFVPTLNQNTADNDDAANDSNIASEPTPNVYLSGLYTLSGEGEPDETGDFVGDDQDDATDLETNGNMTVDFGFRPQLSIGSVVFEDAGSGTLSNDANGVQDAGEEGINNTTVSLFRVDPANSANLIPVIVDADGVYQSDQTTGTNNSVVTSALINSVVLPDGSYNFSSLPPDNYVIQVTPAGGLTPTENQVANPENGVNLDSNFDTSITGLPAGTYQSGVIQLGLGNSPVGAAENNLDTPAVPETDPSGANQANDANSDLTIDFGLINRYSVGSIVFEDADNDGIQDVGEVGLAGTTVGLFDAAGNEIPVGPDGILGTADDATSAGPDGILGTADDTGVVTGADGLYNFSGLPPGEYEVEFTPPAAVVPSSVQVPDPDAAGVGQDRNLDSNLIVTNVNATSFRTGTFTLGEGNGESEPASTAELDPSGAAEVDPSGTPDGRSNLTVDAGFFRPLSLGSFVWQDINADGQQSANELGIAGAIVTLQVSDGNGGFAPAVDVAGQPVGSVTTLADGLYQFSNLPLGDYRVRVQLADYVPSPVQTIADNNDTETDSNIASTVVGLADTFESGTFTLSSGDEPNEGAAAGDDQDGAAGSAADLNGNNTVDFGFVAPLSVGSFVWNDLDGDGIQDSNEPPLAGANVRLLVDDGTGNFVAAQNLNSTGNAVADVVTGADGLYRFDNLPAGRYVVEVTPPVGLLASPVQNINADDNAENDSNIASESVPGTFRSAPVTLSAFDEPAESDLFRGDTSDGISGAFTDQNGNNTLDFGFVETARLGNRVWLDQDRDGVQDANEDGIANVTVNLFADSDGNGVIDGSELTTPAASVTTGSNGEYLFDNLRPGVVYQTVVDSASLPAGLTQTFDENDGVGATDNSSGDISLLPGEYHETADFGYAPPPGVGAIGDTIWIDANDDGVIDPNETGIPGVTVSLTPSPTVDLGNGPGVAIMLQTDANGRYLFTGLPLDETYVVTVDTTTLPANVMPSTSGLGDPDVRDGNAPTADNSATVVLDQQTPVNLDADFGYLPDPAQNNSIGQTVWRDSNRDGVIDATESRIANVTVALLDSAGNTVATTVTDAQGNYSFVGLPDGDYTVVVTDQNNVLNSLQQTFDADDAADPANFNATTPNRSVVTGLGVGVDTPVAQLDQNFGYVDTPIGSGDGSISSVIFLDQDGSGAADPGEGLAGVSVSLFDPGPDGDITTTNDNVLIGVTTTDANGNYSFTGLDTSAGGESYQVVVDPTTLPNGGSGLQNTVDPVAGDPLGVANVVLTDAAPTADGVDFGYGSTDNNSISGTLWPDANGDGNQSESGGFAGVTVELQDANGQVIQTTTTDIDGNYSFEGLPDGVYRVVVTDDNNVLSGVSHTDSPNGASDTGDQTSKDDSGYEVDLDSAGTQNTPVSDQTGDFGYQPVITNPISLGSFIASIESDDQVLIKWVTQTEVANLGFNLYARIEGEWVVLNESLILGQGDSVSTQSYELLVTTAATMFAISDIDLNGKETLHGPYALGEQYGSIGDRTVIDWAAEKAERESKKAQREKRRKRQQIERKQLRLKSSS